LAFVPGTFRFRVKKRRLYFSGWSNS